MKVRWTRLGGRLSRIGDLLFLPKIHNCQVKPMPIPELVNDFIANLVFIFQRLTWISILDITLVTLMFFGILDRKSVV